MTDTTTSATGGAASAAPRRVIYKYGPLTLDGLGLVLVAPRVVFVGADPLDDDVSGPSVWIEHTREFIPDHPRLSQIDLAIVPAGIEVPVPPWSHAGSAVCGSFIWHVYQCVTMLWVVEPPYGTVMPKP